jgi:hypothetical protein
LAAAARLVMLVPKMMIGREAMAVSTRTLFARSALALLLWNMAGATVLAQPPAAPPPAAGPPARDDRPDTVGTGPFPAIKEEVASLPDHVVYRPADLSKLGSRKLGIVGWGNGACVADGASTRFHLLELASHGYVVIAPGGIHSGPGATPAPPRPAPAPGSIPAAATRASDVMAGVDWAIAQNANAASPLHGHVDTAKIAVSGFSCGGVQAIELAADPRVKAVIIQNSGLFPDGASKMAGMDLPKSALAKYHAPVLYILGGETDIAYVNGHDDFDRIGHVPIMIADLKGVGHGGTYHELNGGVVGQVASAWLEWQLFGDHKAGALFAGPDCGLCKDPRWVVARKQFDALKP